MSDPRHALGLAAEEAIGRWLESAGWRILASRHRSPGGGEVDLIALDPDRMMVAIEVRARRSHRAGDPMESVDRRRVARLSRTLASFAAASGEPHVGLRVDLVSVEPEGGDPSHWRARRQPGIG